jgi:hypothetical protein
MRKPCDPSKVAALIQYYIEIKQLWREGKLHGKMENLIAQKAQELGFSRSTAWSKIKKYRR